jgi:hypothetical protein
MTGALKNMFGTIPDPLRVMHHHAIHQVLADLNSLFRHKMLVVLDGLVGMEGQGPLYGTPVPMNLLAVSRNPLAIDQVAAAIMEFDWRQVEHLRLFAGQYGEGLAVEPLVEGLTLAECQRPFQPATRNLFVRTEGWLMQYPPVVRFLFSDFVRGKLTRRIAPLLKRLRGGSFAWYDDDTG